MRIKSKWHDSHIKSADDIGGALSFVAWRLTRNALEDLINEDFIIEKAQVFDVIAEYLCFLIQCIDRLIFSILKANDRKIIMKKLIKQCSFYYAENKSERIGEEVHHKEFLKLYNERVEDYSAFNFTEGEPDYSFYRYFAEKIKCAMTKVDEKWIVAQMIEIQAPKAFETIKKSVDNTVMSVHKISAKKIKNAPTTREIRREKRRLAKNMPQNLINTP